MLSTDLFETRVYADPIDVRSRDFKIEWNNIVDLLVPFQSGYYYNRAMGGSFSIKSVLPAIFSNDPSLDYHNLEGVHNGGEAMSIFPRIASMPPEEQATARRNLLKYCELDTYAMVKVWEELCRVGRRKFKMRFLNLPFKRPKSGIWRLSYSTILPEGVDADFRPLRASWGYLEICYIINNGGII